MQAMMKNMLRQPYNIGKRVIVYLACLFPIRKRIVAEAFLGLRDDDNITLYLADIDEQELPIFYVQRYGNRTAIAKGRRLIKNSLRYIWYMHTSSLILTNSRLHAAVLIKRKEQKIIQFWHGIPWKKLVYDQDTLHFAQQEQQKYLRQFSADVAKWDYLWVPNEYTKQKLQSAFRYDGKYIEKMYPADQKLIEQQDKPAYITEIKQKLKIPADKKIVLYMPTFREQFGLDSWRYQYYSNIDVTALAKKHPQHVILTRTHYLIPNPAEAAVSNIIDVSAYQSVSDLYLVSDILITDYSSAIYSFALLRKPIISVQFDRGEYQRLRGLYDDGIADMDIIEIADQMEFNQLDLNRALHQSKPKADYYL